MGPSIPNGSVSVVVGSAKQIQEWSVIVQWSSIFEAVYGSLFFYGEASVSVLVVK